MHQSDVVSMNALAIEIQHVNMCPNQLLNKSNFIYLEF